MDRIRRFLSLPMADRLLFLQSMSLLGVVAVMLRILPFPLVQRLLLQGKAGSGGNITEQVEKGVVWSVSSASRFVPAATCLPQAIVAKLLLEKRGCPATLRLGVAMSPRQELVAHAWIERDGRILIGGTDSYSRYSALPPLEEEGA